MADYDKRKSLAYHSDPVPGKIAIELTKPADHQDHLAMAYSPGVAEPVREIAGDPLLAYKYTGKGNLVAVISNGSAILGLGNLGALASKPVMEGKSLLFKRFAGVNAFDIEVEEQDPEKFIEVVERIAGTFGGINLEDIAAPACFEIERRLIECCDIPIFHDDQHGTAIVTCAGMLSALELQGKTIDQARFVCLGAGSAAISCMRLLIKCGASRDRMLMVDSRGVIYSGRANLNPYKEEFAIETDCRTLADACRDADVFLGLSGPDLLAPEILMSMAPRAIVFACSNPDPEISPGLARQHRDDLIIATGRSDYANQVNNVLGFPFIFRGALDVRAHCINDEMKLAAVYALHDLARQPVPDEVLKACNVDSLEYGAEYIIPKPVDPRLLGIVSNAVAHAAVDSGVAGRPLPEYYPLTRMEELRRHVL